MATVFGLDSEKIVPTGRTLLLKGRKRRVVLETEFWTELDAIAAARGVSVDDLVSAMAEMDDTSGLTSSLRVFVFQNRLTRS